MSEHLYKYVVREYIQSGRRLHNAHGLLELVLLEEAVPDHLARKIRAHLRSVVIQGR